MVPDSYSLSVLSLGATMLRMVLHSLTWTLTSVFHDRMKMASVTPLRYEGVCE